VKRWPTILLVVCAAATAAAQWVVPQAMHGVLSGLLFVLVVLTAFSQRSALHSTIGSLKAAHHEQIESERRYRALFDACSDAIFVYSIADDGRPGPLVEVNEAACVSLGYPRTELMAMTADEISAPEVRRDIDERSNTLREADSLVYETVLLTSGGHRLPVELSSRLVEIRGRNLCLAIARNIAARQQREELLRGMSHEDALTGLLNRRGFFTMVDQAQRRARRLGARVLLMYVDVDGLKRVNDRMGHAAGDALVLAAAEALRLAFRDEDVLARIGGDEFVALAMLGRSEDERLDQETIVARFEAAVAAKRAELGEGYAFSLSFGSLVADWDELGRIDELLARSDARMYEAKRSRRRAKRSAVSAANEG
jgi:diguanylate cyclase (GGDEF)-like protein/PAS domain S-box-containing protein